MSKKDDIKKKLESASDALESAAENVTETAEDAADALKDKAEDAAEAVKEKAKDAAEAVKEKVEDAAEALTGDEAEDGKKKKHSRTPEQERERAQKSAARRKKFKYGTLATLITVIVIAVIVGINVICNMLDERYNWNIDLTTKNLYEIDPQTAEYLKKINQDIKLTMLASESVFENRSDLKVLSETLSNFKAESNGHIDVEYIDPQTHPEIQKTYLQDTNASVSYGSIVVTCGELVKVVPFSDLINTKNDFDYNTGQQISTAEFIGEQSLMSAIIGVTDLHPIKIGMIDKFNANTIYDSVEEGCFQRIRDLLTKNNYEVESIDIATEEINSEYDVLILCAPCADLNEAQITKLSDFLNNDGKCGKNLIYFSTPYKHTATTKLDEFLALWGISFDNAIVIESDSAKAQMVQTALSLRPLSNVPVVAVQTDTSLNENYPVGSIPIVAPNSCPINLLFTENSGRNTYPLLTTSDSCCLYDLDNADGFDPETAVKDKYNVAVLAEQNFFSGGDSYKSSLIAFGSSLLFDYQVAGNGSSYDNGNYLVTMINKLSGKENVFTVTSKSLDQAKLTISDGSAILIRNITIFVIPLFVAVLGILVYVRRRNK